MSSLLPNTTDTLRRAGRVGAGALLIGAPTAMVLAAETPANAATLLVTTNADAGNGSLRAAIASAADGDIIDLSAIAGQTITLQSPINWATATTVTSSSPVTIDGSVSGHVFTIAGAGTHTLTGMTIANSSDSAISCNGSGASSMSVSDSTFSANHSAGVAGAAIRFAGCGDLDFTNTTISGSVGASAIFAAYSGSISLDSSSITGTTGATMGGGLYLKSVGGDIAISNSTISSNTTTSSGAGIFLYATTGAVSISDSTFDGNTAGGNGGGVWMYLTDGTGTTITDSQFTNNTADAGAGLYLTENDADITLSGLTVTGNNAGSGNAGAGGGITLGFPSTPGAMTKIYNSTIARNSAGAWGGGINTYQSVAIYNSTIASNSSTYASGIHSNNASYNVDLTFVTVTDNSAYNPGAGLSASGSVTLTASVISGNNLIGGSAAADLVGTGSVSGTYDLIGTYSAATFNLGLSRWNITDPGLYALANNGGATETMAVKSTSILLDAGPSVIPTFTGSGADQRGGAYVRSYGAKSDIGAFEVQPPPTPPTTTPPTTTTPTTIAPSPGTTINVSPDRAATPSNGLPLELEPGTAAMIEPNGSVTPLAIVVTGPASVSFGTQDIGASLTGSTLSGSALGLNVGGNGSASGFGFQPGSTASVWIQSTPARLGTAAVDANGNFTSSFVVPADLASGNHTVQLQGVGFDGQPRALDAGVTVAATGGLPSTGSDVSLPVVVGASLLLAGGLGAAASRRSLRRAVQR